MVKRSGVGQVEFESAVDIRGVDFNTAIKIDKEGTGEVEVSGKLTVPYIVRLRMPEIADTREETLFMSFLQENLEMEGHELIKCGGGEVVYRVNEKN